MTAPCQSGQVTMLLENKALSEKALCCLHEHNWLRALCVDIVRTWCVRLIRSRRCLAAGRGRLAEVRVLCVSFAVVGSF